MPPKDKKPFAGSSKPSPSSPSDQGAEFIFIILAAIAFVSVASVFFGGRQFRNILNLFAPSNLLSDIDSPIGEDVSLFDSAPVYFTPSGEEIGSQPKGARGTLAEGPASARKTRLWSVDFASGRDGWVSEYYLRNSNGRPFDAGDTKVFTLVSAKNGLDVYETSGGVRLGSHTKGAPGTIALPSVFSNDERYWYVNFDTGIPGWVSESDLSNSVGGAFDSGNTIVGSKVFSSVNSANIRESPGGTRIGGQALNNAGTIVSGPIFVSGAGRFWQVAFDSGVSGWVNENELVLPEREPFYSKFFKWFLSSFKVLSALVAAFFLFGIVYSIMRIRHVELEMSSKEKASEKPNGFATSHREFVNLRWEKVIEHAQSDNPADWKLAILESDIILEEIMDKMGYDGENLGEKLKSVEPSDFLTLEDAWEAHKVRNIIAHRGSDFVLSRREAHRVISMYARVFREFRYIGHQTESPNFDAD